MVSGVRRMNEVNARRARCSCYVLGLQTQQRGGHVTRCGDLFPVVGKAERRYLFTVVGRAVSAQ